MDIFFLIT